MFQVSIREEHDATIVSDNGGIARLMNLGERPIERVVWGGDPKLLGEAVSDIRALHTGVSLLLAAKAGEVVRVTPTPTVPGGRIGGLLNGNGHHATAPTRETPAAAPSIPDVAGWKAIPVEPELSRILPNRILWRLRRAGITTIAQARELATNDAHPGRQSKFVGAHIVAKLKIALDKQGLAKRSKRPRRARA